MAQAPGGTTRLKYAWTLGSFDRDSERSPTHQPTNPPTHQPTNPPTHQPTNPPTHQPTNPPTHQPTNHKTTHRLSFTMPARADLSVARAAITRGSWSEAREALGAIEDRDTHAGASELLGLVSWWLDDAATTFSARERAWSLYLADGDPLGAAR